MHYPYWTIDIQILLNEKKKTGKKIQDFLMLRKKTHQVKQTTKFKKKSVKTKNYV